METKVYYLEDCETTQEKIVNVMFNFPTFVNIETIEMNYLKITIECRMEDVKAINDIMK